MDDDPFPNEWHTADERDMWAEGWILDYANGDGYAGPSAIFATPLKAMTPPRCWRVAQQPLKATQPRPRSGGATRRP